MILKKIPGGRNKRKKDVFTRKENNDIVPLLPVKGYWRGYISLKNIQLVNRDDGTCSFYYLSFVSETAVPIIKGEGNYKVDGNTYRGLILLDSDYIILETTRASSIAMSGTARLCSGGAFAFELVKHQ